MVTDGVDGLRSFVDGGFDGFEEVVLAMVRENLGGREERRWTLLWVTVTVER